MILILVMLLLIRGTVMLVLARGGRAGRILHVVGGGGCNTGICERTLKIPPRNTNRTTSSTFDVLDTLSGGRSNRRRRSRPGYDHVLLNKSVIDVFDGHRCCRADVYRGLQVSMNISEFLPSPYPQDSDSLVHSPNTA